MPFKLRVGRLDLDGSLASLGFRGICAEESLRLIIGVELERPLAEGRAVAAEVEAEIGRGLDMGWLWASPEEADS